VNQAGALTLRLRRIVLVFCMLFLVSTAGYVGIEGYSVTDAIYMTVITLSTVGFGEVRLLTPLGRLFTIGVIFTGVGTMALLFSTVAEYIIAGELAGTLRHRRMMKDIRKLAEHYIICGYGRIGEPVAQELQRAHFPVVIIDENEAIEARCERCGLSAIAGDATDDDILRQAGIERARGLISALDSDAENVFVVLSARFLNPKLTIVARAATEEAARKLRKAGADQVIMPYQIAGHSIVRQILRPKLTSFLEVAMGDAPDFFIEEIEVAPDSPLVGQDMERAQLRTRTGANVLSIVRAGEQRMTDWSPEAEMKPFDTLIALGNRDQLSALARLSGDDRFVIRR
jgi:voltage-gated potassium channel